MPVSIGSPARQRTRGAGESVVTVTVAHGLEAARSASGVVVIVDAFRAYCTAAHLISGGASSIQLVETIDEVRAVPGDVLRVGEERGVRPPDFDLGNSPAEVLRADVGGRSVVMRSSAGTRGVIAALRAGADAVFGAGFGVASATGNAAAALGDRVTVIAAGHLGVVPAEEDEAAARLIADVAGGVEPDVRRAINRALAGRGASRLRSAGWADPADLGLCLAVDIFDFAMRAIRRDGGVFVEPV